MGHELFIIWPGPDGCHGLQLVEKPRKIIQQARHAHAENVTRSFDVELFESGISHPRLIMNADKALTYFRYKVSVDNF